MLKRMTALAFVFAMFILPCLAEDAKAPQLPESLAALKIEAVERAWASFQEAQAKSKQAYSKALQEALEAAQKAKNLNLALAIKGEMDALAASEEPVSKAEFPPKSAITAAQQAFQKEIAAARKAFTAALENAAKAETQKGNLENAKKLKDQIAQPAPVQIGPFPPVTADSPAMDVVKVVSKGRYALAYFQIYNKGVKKRCLMNMAVYFKDKDNQKIIAENSVIIFPFKDFSDAEEDLTQQAVEGFTMGAYAVDGNASLQFVAVGEHQRAADVKKAGVLAIYDDGSRVGANGPANPTNDKTNEVTKDFK